MVDVSFVLRNKAVRAGAAQWLDELPALVAGLEQEWSIRVGRPYGDATEAFVAEAVLEDGTPAALKLVDPDGLLAEAEYDLGILMREDPIELLDDNDPRARARWLAARTGLDVEAIWEWGVVERVSTGLLCTEIGLQPVGHEMLAVAEVLAAT